jgi:hypothetical protein
MGGLCECRRKIADAADEFDASRRMFQRFAKKSRREKFLEEMDAVIP